MSTITYKVDGMMCGHCQKHVKETLEGLDGVNKVEVNLAEGKAVLQTSNNVIDFQMVEEAFADSNYTIQEG